MMTTSSNDSLPDYQDQLGAYHQAFADDLRAMIASLPIEAGDQVLDLASGDGVYSKWLAERVGPSGSVKALDISRAYHNLARQVVGPLADRVEWVLGKAEDLPFPDNTFDLAWCAQSFRSLPDPLAALREMARVVRPGGAVAVLENDALHQVLLPWPVGLELAVRRAEFAELKEELDDPSKPYLGRRLSQYLLASGLVDVKVQTFASNLQAPLSKVEHSFVSQYLESLREQVADRLDQATLDRLDRWINPRSDQAMLNRPDFALTCIDHVVVGVRPSKSS